MIKDITLTCTVDRADINFNEIIAFLKKIETSYNKFLKHGITTEIKKTLSDQLIDLLEIIGEMSIPVFNKRKEIENKWSLLITDNPAKAREEWIKEYRRLHRPYDKLKDRTYSLFCQINSIPEKDQ